MMEQEVAHHAAHTFFDADPHPAAQFEDAGQQREAATLGMWVFLATEVLLFGGLFAAFFACRHLWPAEFREGARHLIAWIGTTNTAVLLASSLCVALAVDAAGRGKRRRTVVLLLLTIALGAAFLGLKAYEYYRDYQEGVVPWLAWDRHGEGFPREVRLFMVFYFVMTAIHATHMVAGISVFGVLTWMTHRGRFSAGYDTPIENAGLYWHFVDIVWVFLLPTFYLVAA